MDRKRINLSMTDEQFARIEESARNSGMTVTAFCSSLILSGLHPLTQNLSSSTSGSRDKRRYITFSDDEAYTLRSKASSLGLSDAEYIRRLISSEDFKIYEINSEDIKEYIDELHPLIESVNMFINLIKRAGNNDVYRQDIDSLNKNLADIKTLMSKQLMTSYSNRKKVYKDMIKNCKGGGKNGNS